MATQKLHTELNPVQVSLLRLFNRPMSEEDTIKLKKLMVNHYSELLEEEVSKIFVILRSRLLNEGSSSILH